MPHLMAYSGNICVWTVYVINVGVDRVTASIKVNKSAWKAFLHFYSFYFVAADTFTGDYLGRGGGDWDGGGGGGGKA